MLVYQNTTDKIIQNIRKAHASEYAQFDQQVKLETEKFANQILKIDANLKRAQQQLFAANLNLAKAQHKMTPYKSLSFARYIKVTLFNETAI